MNRAKIAACDCGSERLYDVCCGSLHAGLVSGTVADTAERLMRSRYVAYVHRLEDYLLATWHATTRPATLNLEEGPQPRWLGLEVRRAEERGDAATVEFVARYRMEGRGHRQHEISRFVREAGRWYYVSAE